MSIYEKIKEIKEREQREDREEMVLENIEDVHYQYFIGTMLQKVLVDILENYNYEDIGLDKIYALTIEYLRSGNDNQEKGLRITHYNQDDDGITNRHKAIDLSKLNDEEVNYFISYILTAFQSYGIEFKNTAGNENINFFYAEPTLRQINEMYWQELQKFDFEKNSGTPKK